MRTQRSGVERRWAAVVVVASLATTLTLAVAAPAGAAADDGAAKGNDPLPGYTISSPPLPPLATAEGPTRVLQGVHHHSAFTIEVPPHWNGELAMYAHGFRGNSPVLTVDPMPPGLRETVIAEGYAWAASSYPVNGYDVGAAVEATRDLAMHVGALVRRPSAVYLVGASMGGHATVRSLEQYPGFYAAAMPICGVLGGSRVFDVIADQNLVAQALAGVSDYPPTPDYATEDVPRIERALGIDGILPGGEPRNDLGRQFRAIVVNRTGGTRPGTDASFAAWYSVGFAFTLWNSLWPSGGGGSVAEDPLRLATNVGTDYQPSRPIDVNASVLRIAPADPAARRSGALTASPRVEGRPRVPVLTLHDIGDLFVPLSMEQQYARDVAAHHRPGLLVQRAIRAAGHCEFSPVELGQAWDDLVTWRRTGVRPGGDPVNDAAAVARNDFGCAYTDRSAYGSPGSRALFAPCPG